MRRQISNHNMDDIGNTNNVIDLDPFLYLCILTPKKSSDTIHQRIHVPVLLLDHKDAQLLHVLHTLRHLFLFFLLNPVFDTVSFDMGQLCHITCVTSVEF